MNFIGISPDIQKKPGGHERQSGPCSQEKLPDKKSGEARPFGRAAIHEILRIDAQVRRMINCHATVEEIVAYAREHQGMHTLQESGIILVKKGVTTPEELVRIACE